MKQTYVLDEDDIKAAVAAYLRSEYDIPFYPIDVKIEVSAGSPYYNQFDAGTPPSVKISAVPTLDEDD